MKKIFLILISLSFLSAEAQKIEIGLIENSPKAYFSFQENYFINDQKFKATTISLIRTLKNEEGFVLIKNQKQILKLKLPLEIKSGKELFKISSGKFSRPRTYRGILKVKKSSKGNLNFINELDIEDYLLAVAPSEMPNSWPIEALKAQAVCARTYSYKNLNRRRKEGFDLKAGVEDQAYHGYKSENSRSTESVKTTEGLILSSNNSIINAFYSSSAGSLSAFPDYVWGLSPEKYLVSVFDFDAASPYKHWIRKFNSSEINEKLKDLKLENIIGINILERSPEGRVSAALISGIKDLENLKKETVHLRLTGEELRHKLCLPSTFYELSLEENSIIFEGKGFGHGIGMSQYGAKHLASIGKNHEEILLHYYPETKLRKIED
jgi:stage II sporulation protein D